MTSKRLCRECRLCSLLYMSLMVLKWVLWRRVMQTSYWRVYQACLRTGWLLCHRYPGLHPASIFHISGQSLSSQRVPFAGIPTLGVHPKKASLKRKCDGSGMGSDKWHLLFSGHVSRVFFVLAGRLPRACWFLGCGKCIHLPERSIVSALFNASRAGSSILTSRRPL